MSRSDDRTERAWDDGVPGFRQRLVLAIRQSPVRGVVVFLLLLLSFGFLVAALVEFRDAIGGAIAETVDAALAGDPTTVLAVVAVLVALGTGILLFRRG